MADNLKLPPKEVICELINKMNTGTGAAFTPEMLEFGVPTQSAATRNTDLTVTAVDGSGYVGNVVINYDRVHLQSDVVNAYKASGPDRDEVFSVGNATRIKDMIPEINARFGINLTDEDYVDAALPAFVGGIPNETLNVQVTADADSLCYRASFIFKLKSENIELSTVIVNKTMSGLVYAPPA